MFPDVPGDLEYTAVSREQPTVTVIKRTAKSFECLQGISD